MLNIIAKKLLRPLREKRHQRANVLIHIGLHKTGSTSIQHFMASNRERLRDGGILYYRGALTDHNHVDLHVVSIRPDRGTPFKRDTGIQNTPEFLKKVQGRVRDALAQDAKLIVFSNEGISLIAHRDEALRLKSLFTDSNIKILVYLRNKADFLASYRAEMEKYKHPITITQDSYAYTEDDSWLINYPERLKVFREVFGDSNIVTIDYDKEMESHGSVLPSFISAIGAESLFAPSDWQDVWLNARPASN
ncbi:hypothetical protein [Rhizobium multihospitium]|uniref:Sulfotransferase family protein n=1 Tax=Rhizobium multihospitium TaxID=410764 RepID=A0A1C3WP34_9HYPH|nr:hypothetical protein [Rhizobium multihospitium]SCB41695.1 hypothetical protein GA0061103_5901 [Rhizobium multihospitium]